MKFVYFAIGSIAALTEGANEYAFIGDYKKPKGGAKYRPVRHLAPNLGTYNAQRCNDYCAQKSSSYTIFALQNTQGPENNNCLCDSQLNRAVKHGNCTNVLISAEGFHYGTNYCQSTYRVKRSEDAPNYDYVGTFVEENTMENNGTLFTHIQPWEMNQHPDFDGSNDTDGQDIEKLLPACNWNCNNRGFTLFAFRKTSHKNIQCYCSNDEQGIKDNGNCTVGISAK